MTGALLPQIEGFQQQRRRAGDEEAHVAHCVFGQASFSQQTHVQRGHAHENRGFGQLLHDDFGVEFGQPDHLAAVQQRAMQRHKQAVNVEDGQGVDEHVIRLPTPVILQNLRVGQQVVVRQHRAFAAPCRAAGVQNGGQIVGLADGGRVLVAAMGGAV